MFFNFYYSLAVILFNKERCQYIAIVFLCITLLCSGVIYIRQWLDWFWTDCTTLKIGLRYQRDTQTHKSTTNRKHRDKTRKTKCTPWSCSWHLVFIITDALNVNYFFSITEHLMLSGIYQDISYFVTVTYIFIHNLYQNSKTYCSLTIMIKKNLDFPRSRYAPPMILYSTICTILYY